jgi:hypothetical protein
MKRKHFITFDDHNMIRIVKWTKTVIRELRELRE